MTTFFCIRELIDGTHLAGSPVSIFVANGLQLMTQLASAKVVQAAKGNHLVKTAIQEVCDVSGDLSHLGTRINGGRHCH